MAGKAEALNDEAARWFVRLQADVVEESTREAFGRWLAEPAHAVAYARVEAAWERAERLRAAGEAAEAAPRAALQWTRRAASLAGLAAGGGLIYALARPREERFRTAVGERRRLALADGSAVELNTATRLNVDFTPKRRKVRLLAGEAHFEVAKDAARPFVVYAGGARVRAVGTAFNVRLRDRLVEVTVTEGVVAVSDGGAGREARAKRTVAAGQGAVAGPGAVATLKLEGDDLERRMAWRDGRIELRGETLEQAVAEFNRYREHKLVVADPTIAGLRVGGSFGTGDSDRFLGALEQGFHVRAVDGEGGVTYLVRAA